jgi:hypothetical protein
VGYVKKFKTIEDDFARVIKDMGEVTPSSTQEDINEHWDVKLSVKFDVKAVKKTNRSDIDTDDNIHWVELINVRGAKGWLYGEANYFSFELNDYWVIVAKEALQSFIAEKCKTKEKSERPELYKLYSRAGRSDMITLVKTIDLMYISEQIIKK